MPARRSSRASRRQLLIALNQSLEVKRSAVPLLGRHWCSWAGGTESDGSTSLPRVPKSDLEAARDLARRAVTLASQEHERARRFGDRIVVHGDDDYPLCLDDLPLPPPVLYIVGTLPAEPAIAIVGSRSCDAYGRAVAELFARRLALAGLVVVSGLARGIDTVAHRAALDAAGGQTVGVLGCGIDVDYPRRSARLRGAIAERGAIISEFPIGCSPQPRHFPIRNRIIAALSSACLVVQAARRSGSLITAHLALELGRDVFAIPGRIFDARANGANSLIRDGAHPVQDPDEILETLPANVKQALDRRRPDELPTLDGPAGQILASTAIGEPRTTEEICHAVGLPLHQVLSVLVELEIAGRVARHPGSRYSRKV